jgi:hypothetical protein
MKAESEAAVMVCVLTSLAVGLAASVHAERGALAAAPVPGDGSVAPLSRQAAADAGAGDGTSEARDAGCDGDAGCGEDAGSCADPTGLLELGVAPTYWRAKLMGLERNDGTKSIRDGTAAVVTIGYRWRPALVAMYGDFGRVWGTNHGLTHIALGLLGRVQIPGTRWWQDPTVGIQWRLFRDAWSSRGVVPEDLTGIGAGADAVWAPLGWNAGGEMRLHNVEILAGLDFSDLTSRRNQAGSEAANAVAYRFNAGLRLSLDTDLGIRP